MPKTAPTITFSRLPLAPLELAFGTAVEAGVEYRVRLVSRLGAPVVVLHHVESGRPIRYSHKTALKAAVLAAYAEHLLVLQAERAAVRAQMDAALAGLAAQTAEIEAEAAALRARTAAYRAQHEAREAAAAAESAEQVEVAAEEIVVVEVGAVAEQSPSAVVDPTVDHVTFPLGDRRLITTVPVGPITRAMQEAGFRHGGRDAWLRYVLIAAEGGDHRKTTKQAVRDMRLRPGTAADTVATLLIDLVAQTGPLCDSDVVALTAGLLARLYAMRHPDLLAA